VQFPEPSPALPDDYSDVASVDSQKSATEGRKYQRGGRKKSKSRTSRIPPVPESQNTPEDEDPEVIQQTEKKEVVCPECASRKRTESPKPAAKPFETGFKAFNVKRAEASGGRPFGVRTKSSKKSKAKYSPETKKKKKKKKKKMTRKKTTEVQEYDTVEESDEEPEEEEEPAKKPVSIRLDLNLVIEVFLRAKIQGDVTITFLE